MLTIAFAQLCPLSTAPSIVAGRPVSVQSPARKRFFIEVFCDGLHSSTPGWGENVACRSFITLQQRSLAGLVSGNTFLSSLSAISTNFSEGTSIYSCAPLMTNDKRPLYVVSLNIFSLLKTHWMGEFSNATKVCSVRGLLNKRCIEIIGDGCSAETEFNSVPKNPAVPASSL